MNLDQYLSTHSSNVELAAFLNLAPAVISQWRRGIRCVPIIYCARVEAFCMGMVPKWELRPQDWHLIWPELQERPDAPPVNATQVA